MTDPIITDLKSVVLTSAAPDRTAHFYRDLLGLPLEEERHRGTLRHWAGAIGAQHLAVHPREGFWIPGDTDTVASFTVPDLDGLVARLEARGVR